MSLYDGEGERLSTVRMARMPESKKVTLKTMVGAEVEAVLGQRPDLQLVKICRRSERQLDVPQSRVARGRRAHRLLPRPRSISAMPSMRPMEPMPPRRWRSSRSIAILLRYDDDGVAQVIRALRHLRSKHPECERIAQVPGLLPQPSTPHGLCRGEGPGIAYRLRGGGGDMQDLGH